VLRRRFGERKCPIHHDPQRAVCDVLEVALDDGVHALMLQHQLGTQESGRRG
jgi:hypothetical protein